MGAGCVARSLHTGFLALFKPGACASLRDSCCAVLLVIRARIAPHLPSDNLFGFLIGDAGDGVLFPRRADWALAPGLGVDSAIILVILFTATLLVVLVAMAFFAQEVYSASEVLHLSLHADLSRPRSKEAMASSFLTGPIGMSWQPSEAAQLLPHRCAR